MWRESQEAVIDTFNVEPLHLKVPVFYRAQQLATKTNSKGQQTLVAPNTVTAHLIKQKHARELKLLGYNFINIEALK
ncbi:hypothetical protein JCM19231_2667 [Vibrio ishigakensis]|uniref:Uncharacterized protein n=1 Tax=Vibrio ishigakensis TaxID=1481914 RepID=A0A0B8P2L2_9VIBR|nr:hypothetical protein JCM19231_2667 [Vibrio ishigakensis]